jgi:hypothetical protein
LSGLKSVDFIQAFVAADRFDPRESQGKARIVAL